MPFYHASAAALALIVSTLPSVAEDYTVRWTVVEHDVTPIPQTASQAYVARFSRNGDRFSTDENGQRLETAAGEPAHFTTKLGTPYAVTYDLRGSSIIRTAQFPGFTSLIVIKPDGQGGCRVEIRYRRAPGQAAFESKRDDGSGPSTASSVEAKDARCTMSPPQS